MFIHIPSVVKRVHIFMAMARNIVYKGCLMAELCLHRFVRFECVLIYIFGFHHKQCASNLKDFIFVKFTSHLFSSTGESLKDETRVLLLGDGSLVTLHTLCSYLLILLCIGLT